MALLSLRDGPLPYERRGVLLSPAEINFLRSLQLAVREDWLIFSMVRLADIIKVRPKTRKFQTWNSRIQGKHLDFVLCDYETLDVKLAIELEDQSQQPTAAGATASSIRPSPPPACRCCASGCKRNTRRPPCARTSKTRSASCGRRSGPESGWLCPPSTLALYRPALGLVGGGGGGICQFQSLL